MEKVIARTMPGIVAAQNCSPEKIGPSPIGDDRAQISKSTSNAMTT
jgi:hypothetical protein